MTAHHLHPGVQQSIQENSIKGIWQYIFILAYRQEHLK